MIYGSGLCTAVVCLLPFILCKLNNCYNNWTRFPQNFSNETCFSCKMSQELWEKFELHLILKFLKGFFFFNFIFYIFFKSEKSEQVSLSIIILFKLFHIITHLFEKFVATYVIDTKKNKMLYFMSQILERPTFQHFLKYHHRRL